MTGHYIRLGCLVGERWVAVIEVALHLPLAKIELALGATVEARTIRATPTRKRAAEFAVAAAKHSRHEIPDSSFYLTSLHRLHLSQNCSRFDNAKKFGVSGHLLLMALFLAYT
jgi:hypothetical protein